MNFEVGELRSAYYFAGPGMIRMAYLRNREEHIVGNARNFGLPELAVNEFAHMEGTQLGGVEKLKRMGINAIHAGFDWGFMPEEEEEDWKWFGHLAKLCDEKDILAFAYIQSSNIAGLEWLEKHPECKDWLVRDSQGREGHYLFYRQRLTCCYNNESWLDYKRDLTRKAIALGAHGLFYDNITVNFGTQFFYSPPTKICYCRYCLEKFEQFLSQRGIKPFDPHDLGDWPEDPRFIHWAYFHVECVNNFYREMRKVVDAVKPGLLITSNTYGWGNITYRNANYVGTEIIKIQDFWMIENSFFPRRERSVVISNAWTYRVSQAYERRKHVSSVATPYFRALDGKQGGLFTPPCEPSMYQLGIAEASANGASLVIRGSEIYDGCWTVITDDRYGAQMDAIGQYHHFLADHRDAYRGANLLANVYLVHHLHSLSWAGDHAQPSFGGFHQTFLQHSLPYDILVEEDLDKGDFHAAELVVLPNVRCVSRQQCESLLGFAEAGGKILITGEFGGLDLDGRRLELEEAAKLRRHPNVRHLASCPAWMDRAAEIERRFTPEEREELAPGARNHLLPERHEEIAQVVSEMITLPFTVKVRGTASVWGWRLPDKRLVFHIVNYAYNEAPANVEIRLAPEARIKSAELLSPDVNAQERLSVDRNKVAVTNTRIYDLVRLELET